MQSIEEMLSHLRERSGRDDEFYGYLIKEIEGLPSDNEREEFLRTTIRFLDELENPGYDIDDDARYLDGVELDYAEDSDSGFDSDTEYGAEVDGLAGCVVESIN